MKSPVTSAPPLPPLPLSPALLETYRLRTRRQKQATMVGGHQMRRKGQSLEFYDYRPYMPGDDIRFVDWRASARHGGNGLLVKTFVAEEHMTIVISIDNRLSMQLPQIMPKGLIAAWLAQAVAAIALRSGDQVLVHRLFGKEDPGIHSLKGTGSLQHLPRILNRFYSQCPSPGTEATNLEIVDRYLPPTAVWLIITDFYFDMEQEAQKLAARMANAQDGWRWLITLDLDSWPWEKKYLGLGSRKIDGPGLILPDNRFQIDHRSIEAVENRITAHKERFRKMVSRQAYDPIHWQWPESDPQPADFFRHHFGAETVLQRLFMKGNG